MMPKSLPPPSAHKNASPERDNVCFAFLPPSTIASHEADRFQLSNGKEGANQDNVQVRLWQTMQPTLVAARKGGCIARDNMMQTLRSLAHRFSHETA
ncbi:hypothetical protein Krac_3375 [Ktedonobacter racemifer DSM 44963]|uniref:Uncharacterized protein n=1 Tax=Ktedonobacter racemifer DSM 44963 TaxID=485913 RepID=D6U165_KTERA|nr:hypothetical protein Krac_3375 [Ktedonobacter racemifer DSM 44963]